MTEEILTEEKIDALYQQRLDKASEMREEGVNPYANDFRVDTRAVEFFNTYDAIESKEEVDAILEILIETRKENMSKFEEIQKAFLTHFKIPADCRLSESITTQAHLKFLNERI